MSREEWCECDLCRRKRSDQVGKQEAQKSVELFVEAILNDFKLGVKYFDKDNKQLTTIKEIMDAIIAGGVRSEK